MKKLTLLQNDLASSGKSTWMLCLRRYLNSFRVPHHCLTLADQETEAEHLLTPEDLSVSALQNHLEQSDLVIMEVATGFADPFAQFYHKQHLTDTLAEMGFEMTVMIPVTDDEESYDAVLHATDAYSDEMQYIVAHTPTGSAYDYEMDVWEESVAARRVNAFDAGEVLLPTAHVALENALKRHHLDLPTAMSIGDAAPDLQGELNQWSRKVADQLDAARSLILGDAFRPAIISVSPKALRKGAAGRKRKLNPLLEAMAA